MTANEREAIRLLLSVLEWVVVFFLPKAARADATRHLAKIERARGLLMEKES